MHQALIQQRRVALALAVQVVREHRQMPLVPPLALSILALVDLLILLRVLVDLIQVILQILTRHSLVEVWLRVRQALPVQEQVRMILQLLILTILASLVRVALVLHLPQAPLMPLQVVQVHRGLIQRLQEALVQAVQVVLVRRQMPLVLPQVL